MQMIGQMFNWKVVRAGDGDEYLCCVFERCRITKVPNQKPRFYDCDFTECVFEGFLPSDFGPGGGESAT